MSVIVLTPGFNFQNLDKLRKYELHGILNAYEMRTKPKNVSKKEETFKAMRKPKKINHGCKNPFDMYDEEESNFMTKLKGGQGKYKENLPLK